MRCFVFIDGSNFYHRIRGLLANDSRYSSSSLIKFQFRSFSQWLCGRDSLVGTRYYVGAIRRKDGDAKSEELYANQQRLIAKLQQQGIEVVLGTLIKHPDKSFHEKGVDVRIAVEMIRLARKNVYDKAILLSSDTDLVPAVEEVQSFKKQVLYVGTPKGQSYAISKVANDVRLLRMEDVVNFCEKKLV